MTDRRAVMYHTPEVAAIGDSIRAAADAEIKRIEEARDEATRSTGARIIAQEAFAAAHRQLVWALNQETAALAKEAAANGVSYDQFIANAISTARSKAATWSGGAHSHHNVIEAVTREAWLDFAADCRTPFIFKQGA